MTATFAPAFRSIFNDPRRALFYILTIAFLVMVILAPTAIANGYSRQLSDLIPTYISDRVIMMNASADTISTSILEYSVVNELRKAGFKRVYGELLIRSKLMIEDQNLDVVVRGVDDVKGFYGYVGATINGSKPKEEREVNIGILLAKKLNIGLGDEIEILEGEAAWRLRVVGIIDCSCPCDYEIMTGLNVLWKIVPDLKDKVSLIELQLSSGRKLGDVEGFVSEHFNGVKLLREKPFREAAHNLIEITFNSIKNWTLPLYAMILVAAYFTTLKISVDSEKEVAVLRCIGASRRGAFSYILFKSLLIIEFGIIVGLSFGVISAEIIFRAMSLIFFTGSYQPPSLTIIDMIKVICLTHVFAIAGAVYPAFKIFGKRDEVLWRSVYLS